MLPPQGRLNPPCRPFRMSTGLWDVAGMTSEGGGAVAYPVLTLAIKATPAVARDVSLMVQACGMSTASFAILFQHIQVGEFHTWEPSMRMLYLFTRSRTRARTH